MKIDSFFLGFLGIVSVICGCASPKATYVDPTEARTHSTAFTAYDFQQCASAMVDSMLANSSLDRKLRAQFQARPTISVSHIANRTMQLGLQLDTIATSMRTRLVNSDKFDYVDQTMDKPLIIDIGNDKDNPLNDPSQTIDFGQQRPSDYLLYGELIELRETEGRVRDVYYKLTLNLRNKRTGRIDWTDEKEIRKTSTRPVVGW